MSSGLEEYLSRLAKELSSSSVKAGFIDGATYPDGESVANVAYKDEYGDPKNNQPPRPYFRNAISENKDEWAGAVGRGIASGRSVSEVLEVVGAKMAGDIQHSISVLVDPPLAKKTLELRRAKGNTSTKPLVDTGVMIGSVNYEVSND